MLLLKKKYFCKIKNHQLKKNNLFNNVFVFVKKNQSLNCNLAYKYLL